MAEKKKILYIVEAMGGGVFTYIVDLANELVNQFYANVDLFLLPSLFEGFPVVALETQAAGVKSIFSDTIDPAVQITSLVTLMSIQKSNEAWADKMCQILQATTDDTENINTNLIKLRNAGYDVTAEATKLQDIYLQALRCVC